MLPRCALLLAVLAGCRAEPPRSGITVLIESPALSLDNRFALDANSQRIAQLIAPGLITFNDESEPIPLLAESYRELDPQTLEFILRPGLTFHDGARLTSRDVKATLDGMREPELKSPKSDKFEPIESVEIVDERTVRVHLKRPYAPILAEMVITIVPEGRARMPGAQAQDHNPVGAGPFRLVSWPDEEHIELAPFDGYFEGKPRLSSLHFRVVRDETTRVLELLKGRADLVVNAISPAVLPVIEKEPHLAVLSKPGTGYAYLNFNVRSGPTADVRVRRAICQALEMKDIVDHKFHGLAVPATGMLPATHWAYAPTPGCHRDLAAAGKLLDEAGYPKDARGKRALRLAYKTSTDRFRKSIALVLKEQMEGLGIDVEVRSLEFGTFMNDLRHGNFELATLKWSTIIEPDLLRQVFSAKYIPTAANAFGGLNRAGYQNPELDALLEKASLVPHAERKELYARALAILDRDLPYVPMWHESSVSVISDRLAGYEPSAHGFFTPLASAREVAR